MSEDRLDALEKRVAELESVVNEHHHYFAAAQDEQTGVTQRRPNLFTAGASVPPPRVANADEG